MTDTGARDLLGLLAYASLAGGLGLFDSAALAPSLADKVLLAEVAGAKLDQFRRIRDRLAELDCDPSAAMQPFVADVDEFHARSAPSDWAECLVKAYVGDGFAADVYLAAAERLQEPMRGLVRESLSDSGYAEFAVSRIREAISADPALAGRLALWARRLAGEVVAQAQRLAAERESLAGLLGGPAAESAAASSAESAAAASVLAAPADGHASRMAALGLAG